MDKTIEAMKKANNNNTDQISNEEAEETEKKEYDYVHDFEWNEELESKAKDILGQNNDLIETDEFFNLQNKNWEKFYKFNKTNFFKDRHYILTEFEELKNDKRESITLLDIGCGVGNSFYPLIKHLSNLKVNAFDFSQRAVNMAKTHQLYNEERIKLMPLDVVKDDIPFEKADYGILMFVLSAITPDKHKVVIEKIAKKMNKDGVLYFRDYARYDMAQMRFAERKKNKVGDHLYMRKDKTLSYFFEQKEIENLFKECGFSIASSKLICRLIENRKDNKKMHRLWLQIKLTKI